MKPIRVLHVLDGLKSGGAETFIINVYRNINKEKVQFDFLIRNNKGNIYKKEIEQLGGKVFVLPEFPKHCIKNLFELKKFLKSSNYDVIHVHANSLVYIFPLIYAKYYGIKCRIIHSHNTKAYNKIARIIHMSVKKYICKISTNRFACSDLAGKWMFTNEEYSIINNSVDFVKFKFDNQVRIDSREKYNLKDKFVIGHIGRFVEQKNHKFLLKIFKEVYESDKNAVLVLVGEGPLEEEIRNEINILGISEGVRLLGVTKDICSLLHSFDVFVFPSLFEGLPFTLVEAQGVGVPILMSDTITEQVIVAKNVFKLSLNSSEKEWVEKLIIIKNKYKHANNFSLLKGSKFDIDATSIMLEQFYLTRENNIFNERKNNEDYISTNR